MRLAYFTPLPPSKSGIADYNAELLPHLAAGADITVFVEHEREIRSNRNRPYQVRDVMHFKGMHAERPFDLCIYHQGNNPYHEFVYDLAMEYPGLVVLHEHCLHHLIALKTLDRGDLEAYRRIMFQTYGRSGAVLADTRERGLGSQFQQFLMPLNYPIVARSLGIIVHNEFAAAHLEIPDDIDLVKRQPGALAEPPLVKVIPHHLAPQIYELDSWSADECRATLHLPADKLIVGAFGYVTEVKRLPILVKAFQQLLSVVPNALLVIVGEDHWAQSIAPLISELDLDDYVTVTGYVNEQEFFTYLKAVDIVVNLRYPTAGETSGTLIRTLGAGKPVIVSDYGHYGELPDEICLKVPVGDEEEQTLYQQLRRLAFQPMLRKQLSTQAMNWARRECDIKRCAAQYLDFAKQVVHERPVKPVTIRQSKPTPNIECDADEALNDLLDWFADEAARGYIFEHRRRLIDTLKLIPKGDGSQRLLELSSYLQFPPLLHHYGKYAEISTTAFWHGEPQRKPQHIRNAKTGEDLRFDLIRLNVEGERFPFEDEYFDVVLCCELIEHLAEDPMHMMTEINRVLKWDGLAIITTPNITSAVSIQAALRGQSPYLFGHYNRENAFYGLGDRHNREYSPADVKVVLEASGFDVVELVTHNSWHAPSPELEQLLASTFVPAELRGDNIFAVGRKVSSHIERYPEQLYQ
ncbi:MAG: glycosyltransferase [Acidobacteria bacterium]|nr:glycosyltransferase [Acidobacteriota bacterium]